MNTVWVWREMIYWLNPTFSNYLKARWHHYRFCRGRAKVFILQRYIDKWEKDLQEIIAKRTGDQVHSYGYYALSKMMQEKSPPQKVIEFLECNDLSKGINSFIAKLNHLQTEETPDLEESIRTEVPAQGSQEKTPISEPKSISAEIVQRTEPNLEETTSSPVHAAPEVFPTRVYVIAADIHHELYRTPKEYEELKASRSKYVEFIRQQFRVETLAGTIYELRNFDFRPILKDKTETRKGQLRPQLEQIAKTPSIFGEKVSQQVQNLLKKYFGNQTTKED
jgi:hypothetical protein